MDDIRQQYSHLFFDTKVVEEKIPKPMPSMTQLMAEVLSKYGIQNPTVASELANAAEGLVVLRTSPVKS
jgi:hypothetical protein